MTIQANGEEAILEHLIDWVCAACTRTSNTNNNPSIVMFIYWYKIDLYKELTVAHEPHSCHRIGQGNLRGDIIPGMVAN
jgi:hypothetical protein